MDIIRLGMNRRILSSYHPLKWIQSAGSIAKFSTTQPRFDQLPFKSGARRKQTEEDVAKMPVWDFAGTNPRAKKMVYMCGFAATGAMGDPRFLAPRALPHGRYQDPFELAMKVPKKPHLLPFAADRTNVTDISCGYGFTLIAARAYDTDHTLFGCGMNNDSQIGYHAAGKEYKKLYKGDETQLFKPLTLLTNVVPIPLPVKSGRSQRDMAVVKVAAGRAHSLVMTKDGEIFSFGNNAYGQCGRPWVKEETLKEKSLPHRLDGIDEPVIDIIAGLDHSLFLTETGKVYSCGWGADGQTGLGRLESTYIPEHVKGDIQCVKIIQLSCSADCVLAVNDKGDVFGWGNTEYSQLHANSACDTDQQISVPRHLKFSERVGKVVQVAAGGSGCALLNDKGQVFVWGFGILGMGPATDHLRTPTLLREPLFGTNEFSKDVKVTSIYAGRAHYAAINSIGDLYMWGKNRHGLMGLGHELDQYFPFRVAVPIRVSKLSLGLDHTAIVGHFMT